MDRQMRIRFKIDKLRSAARLWEQSSWKDSEMEPFVEELEPMISGKQLLLFGSYGWVTESGCVTGAREWKRREHI